MLSSALYTMLKPSKTTSPNRLFDYDCVTLYYFTWIGVAGSRVEVPGRVEDCTLRLEVNIILQAGQITDWDIQIRV